jgi:hypothetical protein
VRSAIPENLPRTQLGCVNWITLDLKTGRSYIHLGSKSAKRRSSHAAFPENLLWAIMVAVDQSQRPGRKSEGRILSSFLDPLDRFSASSSSRALLVFDCRNCYFLMVLVAFVRVRS